MVADETRGHWWPLLLGALALAGGGAFYLLWPPAATPAKPAQVESIQSLVSPRASGEVAPIPNVVEVDPRKVELGRRLFHDKQLSQDNSVACATCHPLDKGGMDGLAVSVGIHGRLGELNAPSVFNSGFNFRQFWDGRAATLEEQASGPLLAPKEMGSEWRDILAKLSRDADYPRLAMDAYGQDLSPEVVTRALADFQRTLVTPDSDFDRYLKGDARALSAEAREGWRLFRDLGCIACHQGVNLGGNMYANLGLMADFFADREVGEADLGRYNVTGRDEDRHLFKVPGLRNVALTAPYFHDGSIADLDRAVEVMARYQLGLEINSGDRANLVAFLGSLTGRRVSP